MALVGRDAIGGKGVPYFDPKKYVDAVALIVEPRSIRRNVPNENGPRDEVTAQITVFRTEPQLRRGEVAEVNTFIITPKRLVRDLDELMAEERAKGNLFPAVIVKLGQWPIPNTSRKVWVFKQVEDDMYDLAAEYYQEREARTADAIANAPDDFGDDDD